MKIKTILASVILCCSFQTVKGQTNNIYVEALGVGLLGSINYERMIIPDKLLLVRVMVGLVYRPQVQTLSLMITAIILEQWTLK